MDDAAIQWLLSSDEPGIRLQAQRDLLGRKVRFQVDEILAGPIVSRLLKGQQRDGGFGGHPYHKWTGVHWRLVSLVELGVPAGAAPVMAALNNDLDWIIEEGAPLPRLRIQGMHRFHGSIYGNPLACAVRLGLAKDPRAAQIAEWLLETQWPDGGWNCDRHTEVTHSSFYESIIPMWGLAEYGRATGNRDAAAGAHRAAEFFLDHRVYKSHTTGEPGETKWLRLRYPEYWHYDYLFGLVLLMRAGALPDARARDALELLRQQQQPDGRWVMAGGQHWRGTTGPYGDPAMWSAVTASQMLTLNALRVLRAADA